MLTHVPRRALIATGSVLTLLGRTAGGHALEHRTVQGGVGIQALYDDGRPAAFSPAQAFPPGSTQVFAEGLTDRAGRFVFAPPTSGIWRVTVDDGMGHALETRLTISGGALRDARGPARPHRASGVVAGLGLLFGGFGLWALWRARRRERAG